ncbi:unnamed protein product [Urochloa decumbens]|uniref:Receptor-like serine/threonine-protein kinase n=1 Tax=Urochloa decumbens TaxID=240449 RepID=A0ABC8ZCL9_9POAL
MSVGLPRKGTRIIGGGQRLQWNWSLPCSYAGKQIISGKTRLKGPRLKTPFLLAMAIPPLPQLLLLLLPLMPAMQAQPGPLGYPTATVPSSWTNSPSLQHGVNFTDGSAVRALLLSNLYEAYQGPSFAAGFYCAPPCDAFLFAVYIVNADSGGGIVMPRIGMPQVVWAANRGRPVGEGATLSLTAAAGLVLRDADGSLVWSADTSGEAVAGLQIARSGNLVLLDDKNVSVWQSFDHPTDCLVPGQILAEGMVLTPNISTTNFTANDQLHITVRDAGLYAYAGSSPPQVYYPDSVRISFSDTKPKNGSSYVAFINGSLASSSSPDSDSNELIHLAPPRSLQYIRFETDGHLRLYEWQNGWVVVQDVLGIGDCDYPIVCGQYGLCNDGQCSCPSEETSNLAYFRPVDNRRINLGCVPLTPISCASMQDHQLLALSNVSYFNYVDTTADLPQMIDEESCKKACLQNCSCKAAFFQYFGNYTSQGSCYLPTQLFSLQVNQWEVTHYSSSAYLKVQITQSPPSPSPSNSNGTVNRFTPTGKRRIGAGAIVGFTVAGVISLLTVIIITLVVRRRRYQNRDDADEFGEVPGMTTRFTFEELKVATGQFGKLLGKGGFGSVFEGQIGEQRVAVKQLDRAGHGKKEFLAEVETIGNIHHINLVRLIGFCAEKSHRLLVYECMSNGSLDNWIYFRDANRPLDWHTRCRIITDIAKGLAYLHEECRQRIAHLDIKPQNILLDDNFSAKLSDFGLSKMIDRDKSQVVTRMRGTPGYLAPEWLTSQITEKVDIYSFGVVVMEIISGRKNLDYSQPQENVHLISIFQEKARNNQLEDLINDEMQIHKEEVIRMMKLAMWCLQIDYNKRPQMSVVVKVLEGTMNVETNIEINFVAVAPGNLDNDGKLSSSAPLLASHLSGPR